MPNPRLVKSIFPGIPGETPGSGSQGRFTAVGKLLFFVADDGVTGRELWRSDGTSNGTFLVSDIYSGSSSSEPNELTALGESVYFKAIDGTKIPNLGSSYSNGLWKSNGTKSGTSLVANDQSPFGIVNPIDLEVFNSTLYFSSHFDGGTLWRSDGSTAGTQRVNPVGGPSGASELTAVGGSIFFSANDTSFANRELWKTDGTDSGTVRVADINPGGIGSSPRGLIAVGSTLLFGADDGKTGLELWKTDGSSIGTVRVADVNPGPANGLTLHSRELFTKLGQTIFFSANDGNTGHELWKSDGSQAGTRRVYDIKSGPGDSRPSWITAVGNRVFFTANDEKGNALWRSDGSSQGTQIVSRINTSNIYQSEPRYLVAAGNYLFFTAIGEPSQGRELWRSDGTPSGTVLVADILPGGESSDPRDLTVVANTLYFSAKSSATSGRQLWALDLGNISNPSSQVSSYAIERLNLTNIKSDGNEGSRHTFRIKRSGNTALAGSVRFSTSNGTATAGVDFLPFARDIQFQAGEREKDVYVDSLADSRKEGTERFNVSIAKINSRDTISTASTFGNIFDGILPATFSISRISASGSPGQSSSIRKNSDGREGEKPWFTLTRSGNTQNTATVNVSTASGSAVVGVDFKPYSASVTFAPGETSKDIYVETLRDVLVESSERFDVRITPRDQKDKTSKASAYGTISNRPAEYMRVDKDGKPFLMWDYTADYAGNRNYFIQHIPFWNVSFRVKNERLDPSLPTYVYTHGWKDNPASNDSNIMFSALGRGNYNVINVDWSSLASVDSIGQPDKAVTVTKQVGETVADFLIKNRLSPEKITLIGHSLGSFVSASAANEIVNRTKKKVKELVALDNAFGTNYDIDARTPGTDPPLNFSTSLANATTSYTVSDLLGGIDVLAGDNIRAATAQNAYIVQYVRSNNLPLLSLDPLKNSTQRATGLHNGVIGIYADLFLKGALHPRLQKSFDASGKNKANGGFDGVIAAALPWSWELNGEGKIAPIRKGPKAIGWVEKYSDPLIYGTDANDIMFFDQFTEVHPGSWLVGYSGNDWLVANQTDKRGVDRLTGGQGADQFWFGYQRYGQKTFPYLNDDVPTDNYGGSSYAVVMDFNPNEDFLNFAWTSSQITYKAGSAINPNLAAAEGPGVGFLNNNDLIAYVRGLNPSQVPGLIRNGRVSFEQVAQLDRALFA